MSERDGVILMGKNVLIELPAPKETSKGGLHLPESAKRQDQMVWGKIVDVGKDVKDIEIGDEAYLGGFRVGTLEFDDKMYGITSYDEIPMIRRT